MKWAKVIISKNVIGNPKSDQGEILPQGFKWVEKRIQIFTSYNVKVSISSHTWMSEIASISHINQLKPTNSTLPFFPRINLEKDLHGYSALKIYFTFLYGDTSSR